MSYVSEVVFIALFPVTLLEQREPNKGKRKFEKVHNRKIAIKKPIYGVAARADLTYEQE
jgi:hypothetical protein